MVGLVIVAGACGKGDASYDEEHFTLPDRSRRPIETVADLDVHGDVAGGAKSRWADDALRGLKGGLALASNLELSGTLALAAGALGSGLAALGGNGDAPRALVEITFLDGLQIVALIDPALSAVLLHDREVVRRTLARAEAPLVRIPTADKAGMLTDARTAVATNITSAVEGASDAAGAVLATARGWFGRKSD